MAKKLLDLQEKVNTSAKGFSEYLKSILDKSVFEIIENISKQTNLYIFSGIIRNYFLGIKEMRDIDIVLEDPINIEVFFSKHKTRKNSFGGYKIFIGKTRVDLWYLHNTWAIKYQKKMIDIPLEKYIPYTAFFNFSAIIFSFNENKFYNHNAFLAFLRDKEINFLFEPNANTSLCIVNTFYYSDKYKLKVSNKLMRYVIKMHKSGMRNYELIQKKHFGKILYTRKDIEQRILNLSKNLAAYKRKRLVNKKKAANEIAFPP